MGHAECRYLLGSAPMLNSILCFEDPTLVVILQKQSYCIAKQDVQLPSTFAGLRYSGVRKDSHVQLRHWLGYSKKAI